MRFYISHEISYGVAASQIFNWSSLLYERGVDTQHLIFYTNRTKLLSMINGSDQKIRCVRSSTRMLFRDIIFFVTLFKVIFKSKNQYEKIILQTRNNGVTLALSVLKLFFDFKIIYEIRGFGENTLPNTFLAKLKTNIRKNRDQNLIKLADRVFCVSNEMKRVVINSYSISELENKFVVFPGTSSSRVFYSDETLRRVIRHEYNIGDRTIVILYSGNLDKPWQVPDQIFRFFKYIEEFIDARLFVLTPNLDLVQHYLKKYNVQEGMVFSRNCSFNELNKFYNAADYGILLRENKLLNNVASPTKFSEYILSGLPVIITDSIVDYSEFVKKNIIGFVLSSKVLEINNIQEYNDFLSNELKPQDLKISNNLLRSKISSIGKLKLSKESFIDCLSDILIAI